MDETFINLHEWQGLLRWVYNYKLQTIAIFKNFGHPTMFPPLRYDAKPQAQIHDVS